MKAIAKTKPEPGFERIEAPIPKVGKGDVLIKVKVTSICGTDYHIYNWDAWARSRVKPPRIVGHEFAGEVVEVGAGVRSIKPGDMVAGESHIACGDCHQCRIGQRHICENLTIIGVDIDGSFAEYVAIPEENAWKLWPDIPLEIGSILEPLGNAIHAALVTDISGNTVAVLGCGPAGLSSIAVCRTSGSAEIIAVDINSYRLDLARRLGATITLDANAVDVVHEIMDITDGRGVDIVLEMSGSVKAVKQAFQIVKNGGRITLFGLPNQSVELNIADDIIFKEARVFGIVGREMFRTWYKLEALLRSGRLRVDPLITHRMPLEEYEESMRLMRTGNCGKIVMIP